MTLCLCEMFCYPGKNQEKHVRRDLGQSKNVLTHIKAIAHKMVIKAYKSCSVSKVYDQDTRRYRINITMQILHLFFQLVELSI